MRLLRKAIKVLRTKGVGTTASLTLRKVLHVTRIRPVRGYAMGHFAFASEIDPYHPGSIPTPRLTPSGGDRLRLRWYMPEPGKGSGGHRTLFRLIDHLSSRGHPSEVAVTEGELTGRTREGTSEFIREHFAGVETKVVWDTDDLEDVDIVVATSWQSAYIAAADVKCAARAYVVQDWEPDFYPRGTESILAEQSYLLGYHHVTASPWLAERIARMGARASYFHLGADQHEYFPDPQPRVNQKPHIVFYARPFTPRRCFEMGMEALRLLDDEMGEGSIRVTTVGAKLSPLAAHFPITNKGIVPPDELRKTYSSADLVLVLSATNISLVPMEAALCEVPVVELDVESVAGSLVDGVSARLAKPSARSLAEAMHGLLDDRAAAASLAKKAREHALTMTWDAAGNAVEEQLRALVRSPVAAPT